MKATIYNNIYNIIYNVILFFALRQFETKWKKLIEFIIFLQFISFYVLQHKNYIYYTFFVILNSLAAILYFLLNYRFSRSSSHNFLVYFLLFCSVVTFVASNLSRFYRAENNLNEAPSGDKGDLGKRGDDGRPAKLLTGTKLCTEQMVESGNKEIIIYLKENNINKEGDKFFNNLYMKRQYKKICGSHQFINLQNREGNYNSLVTLKKASHKWVRTIMGYKQGFNFLNDYFFIDKKWDTLLSRNKALNEKVSPFSIIKKDEIWKWSL
jgi:hypothetical protein